MSREKQGYEINLAAIREAFPGANAIRIVQAAAFLGIDRHTAAKRIRVNEQTGMVTLTDFARQISI